MIACIRHGKLDGSKDTPCPSCGEPGYDLDDRGARDVVRPSRELAHKKRKVVAAVIIFAAVGLIASFGAPVVNISVNINGTNTAPLLFGCISAAVGHRWLALKLEWNPALRALDAELTRNKI